MTTMPKNDRTQAALIITDLGGGDIACQLVSADGWAQLRKLLNTSTRKYEAALVKARALVDAWSDMAEARDAEPAFDLGDLATPPPAGPQLAACSCQAGVLENVAEKFAEYAIVGMMYFR